MKSLLLRLGCYGADADAPSVHSPHRGTPVLTLPIFDAPAHDHARPVRKTPYGIREKLERVLVVGEQRLTRFTFHGGQLAGHDVLF